MHTLLYQADIRSTVQVFLGLRIGVPLRAVHIYRCGSGEEGGVILSEGCRFAAAF